MLRNCCDGATIVAQRQRSLALPAQAVRSFLDYPCCKLHRHPVDRLQAGAFAPGDFGWIDRERQLRPALEQRLQRASALDTGELVAKTKMDSGTEGDVAGRLV